MKKLTLLLTGSMILTSYAFAYDFNQISNTTYGSNGITWTQIGDTTYGSNGTTWTQIGDTTYGSNGIICQTIGSNIYCN